MVAFLEQTFYPDFWDGSSCLPVAFTLMFWFLIHILKYLCSTNTDISPLQGHKISSP